MLITPPKKQIVIAKQNINPAQYGNLQGWYEARNPNNVLNGVKVATLHDWSGNGRHFTQGTDASRPEIDYTRSINGQPVIWSKGPSGAFELRGNAACNALTNGINAITIIAIAQQDTAGTFRTIINYANNAGSGRVALGFASMSNTLSLFTRREDGGGATENPLGTVGADTWYFCAAVMDYANAISTVYLNDTSNVVNPHGSAGSTSATDSANSGVGSNGAAGSHLNGYFAAIFVWLEAFDDNKVAAMKNDLKRIYGQFY